MVKNDQSHQFAIRIQQLFSEKCLYVKGGDPNLKVVLKVTLIVLPGTSSYMYSVIATVIFSALTEVDAADARLYAGA